MTLTTEVDKVHSPDCTQAVPFPILPNRFWICSAGFTSESLDLGPTDVVTTAGSSGISNPGPIVIAVDTGALTPKNENNYYGSP